MKNGKLVTAYLDECAETLRLIRSKRVEDVALAGERIVTDAASYQACLDDGWTRWTRRTNAGLGSWSSGVDTGA